MRTVIPDNLACVYDITVPYVFDVRKLKKKLDAELEKRHPCFPEQCAVDYRFVRRTSGSKGRGVHVRAVVIDRMKLADLKSQNRGRTLYMGGRHPYAVFSKEQRIHRRAFAAVILLSCIVVLAAVFLFQPESHVTVQTEAETASPVEETAPEPIVMESPVPKDFAEFFAAVYQCGGRFSSLSWNAVSGRLTLTTEGLFPEQLTFAASDFGEVVFGPVMYRESVPEFSITFTAEPAGVLPLEQNSAVEMAAVRQLLFDCGGTPLSETVMPPSITGTVPIPAWASFADGLASMLSPARTDTDSLSENEREWRLQSLDLTRDENTVTLALFLADGLSGDCCHAIPFQTVVPLFYDAPDLPYAPVAEETQQADFTEKDEIGRITREDGSSVVFFHNKEGKIERRIYEN